ncbi:putative molybdopterin-guanine dinucleotide biosynthesis protein [Corynebacterium glutamicum MB001]|uniref:Molybdopterin-guanine dinucleotide biosynthesis protein A n=1 Tax=Corynebacterium glutamicum (strain ATCC 13032 / DSM 20300 / JCM 1318 / BCRC 11384 / CCUG 27702 / LMG 3730 / NBRC 12168 / NCIMB 10025 / NRRL B-2784 / 534) TaxID=196627 RepID=Q8NR62_CORGL|nr:molybdenum cofactor guanylyltransferase [Corynebacterium glutamicum]AGT05185.1 putative molybdopterin-guanine dinucleotide biosynthesis protein [Corynebacterium glutamicum MB001]AIK84883.1 molybdopterin-guanine dinucleotide biosynthesis protein A [Corynebacterium glutamicum]AIK87667.1 molybdopterin-guanine dinucleotide biosynthesis protein A [Corynebacterium glutamicum]ARV64647.1 molybdenum cofactor guanylyltransferase [Corynebacterium glutamicum]ASW13834.1 putative molybdopterin-guanine di
MNIIILAGGEGKRMGGVDKAAVAVDGRTLLDILLSQLDPEDDVVVVSPAIIDGITTVCEEPPLGGPVAGIEAGLNSFEHAHEFTAILAVDAPYSAAMLPLLQAQIGKADVAVTLAADGWVQPLCALWRSGSLEAVIHSLGETRNRPAKALLKQAGHIVEVGGDGTEKDYDTVAELEVLGNVTLPKAH